MKDAIKQLEITCKAKLGLFPSLIVGGESENGVGLEFKLSSPIDNYELANFKNASSEQVDNAVNQIEQAFIEWRKVPAPRRGELVRRIGEIARHRKANLAEVITLEAGKTIQEAQGEVQEWIDVCEFAVGLSRQLYGLTIASERPEHRMMEQWQPLGPIGIISAFNFPMAVWAWNAMLALVCGNTLIWKPSEKTPLCAIACHGILQEALEDFPEFPKALSSVVIGGAEVGEAIASHPKIPLVSATGSVAMGRKVAANVGARLGRSLLELGGNNAMIVTPSANLEMALRAIAFSAVGTAGQRCTTLRRLIAHTSVVGQLTEQLTKVYATLNIGDPRKEDVLLGPLIDENSYNAMQKSIAIAQEQGGTLICGGDRITENVPEKGFYVKPAIIQINADAPIVQHETFAPILYILTYENFSDAIAINNNVPQGLSSAVFTESALEAELFLSAQGSDCGIANVNIGTSGAEIGGAFGGEKETGGGRESGSDSWKNYMRRTTNTINYGESLPLAQGIRFDI